MTIKFLSSVLFVKDIQASRNFYEHILSQTVENDFNLSVGYVGGFSIWQAEHALQTIYGTPSGAGPLGARNAELCFDVDDLNAVYARVTQAKVKIVHPIIEQPWGQRVFRIYDPDEHIIEFGEPMSVVVLRMLSEGKSVEDVTRQTAMPLEVVQAAADSLRD